MINFDILIRLLFAPFFSHMSISTQLIAENEDNLAIKTKTTLLNSSNSRSSQFKKTSRKNITSVTRFNISETAVL